MSSNHASLDAASIERKARLAKLKSLKRKQPESETNGDEDTGPSLESSSSASTPSVVTNYLSGRNYDPISRGPKLGFEAPPTENQETLEDRAAHIADETQRQAEQEEKDEKPIDLFRLQPKKPNWDLKRDVERKMARLNVRTENAIARLVRERIEGAKKSAHGNGEGDNLGIKGEELVEGVHVRERKDAEEERREMEDEDML
jgi:coiled-coil domain-containing protein 12